MVIYNNYVLNTSTPNRKDKAVKKVEKWLQKLEWYRNWQIRRTKKKLEESVLHLLDLLENSTDNIKIERFLHEHNFGKPKIATMTHVWELSLDMIDKLAPYLGADFQRLIEKRLAIITIRLM